MARNKEKKTHWKVHNVSDKVRAARSQDFPSNEDMGGSQRRLGSSVRWDLERQNGKEVRDYALFLVSASSCTRSVLTATGTSPSGHQAT